jgi:hypothetical protein
MSATSWQRKSEAPDLGAAIIRQLRGLVARATEGDLEAIEQLRLVEAQAGHHVGLAVAGARAHAGYSWAQLAPALGTTRGSASERFKDVEPLPVVLTSCGRVTFSEAARFLHSKRCTTCQDLAAPAQLSGSRL